MAASPSKKESEESGVQSPEESDPPMDRDAHDTQGQGLPYELEVKEQDRWLPIANVARIMKMALPDNAKIAKEAKECMQECVSEFISFITSEASEKCQQEKRKTVNGEDILFAMGSLGFENYAEALKIYLTRYRESGVNQNKPAGGYGTGGGSAAGGSGGDESGEVAGPSGSATGFQQVHSTNENMVNPELETSDENAPVGFGYDVGQHNGNGNTEY